MRLCGEGVEVGDSDGTKGCALRHWIEYACLLEALLRCMSWYIDKNE